ncbi:MAG TPA: PepSY domain-containing protein [Gemmatimonadales bacterium]
MNRTAQLVLALAFAASAASAQAPPLKPRYTREVPAALLAKTKIPEDSAFRIAQAKVPKGAVKAVELENEKGKLIWSWEFTVPGTRGVTEVNVDAVTGDVVGVEHEGA